MFPDIEDLDTMLGCHHLERVRSEFSDPIRGHNSPKYNAQEDDEGDSYPISRENKSSNNANYSHNSAGSDSSAEFNRLSGELTVRISREMDEVMNSVSVQIQRAINDAISNQVLPQIQSHLRTGSGQMTQKG